MVCREGRMRSYRSNRTRCQARGPAEPAPSDRAAVSGPAHGARWPAGTGWLLRPAGRSDRAGRLLIALCLAGACATATTGLAPAADYYFSDCTSGGSGTVSDPYCVDPTGSYGDASFQYLIDGAAPDAASGDTFHLCCGSPCNTSSCTYHLQEKGRLDTMTFAVRPLTGVDNLTVVPYCSGSACATVALSGDHKNDGKFCSRFIPCSGDPDDDDPEGFFDGDTTSSGWHFDGDPLGLGTRHIIVEKFGGGNGGNSHSNFFWTNEDGGGLIVENIVMRYLHRSMWDGDEYYAATIRPESDGVYDCQKGQFGSRSSAIRINGDNPRGPRPIFRNNEIYGVCGPVIRLLGTYSAANIGLDFHDNVVYNTETVFNGHNGKNVRIANNLLYDCLNCLSIEEEVSNFDIEGNTIECRGTYRLNTAYSCVKAIAVFEDEGGPGNNCSDAGPKYCLARNIHIRRNTIRGSSYLGEPGDGTGWFGAGIMWLAHTSPGHPDAGDGTLGTSVIENNIVSHVQAQWRCQGSKIFDAGVALGADSDDDLLIQNNSVFDSACYGVVTDGAGNHTVRNNLLVQSYRYWTGTTPNTSPELAAFGSGSISYSNNSLWAGSIGGDPVAVLGGSSYSCSQINAGNLGTGNKCAAPSFLNTTGNRLTWDLHLAASDTANRNAGAAQGPSVDIDGQPRSDGQIDIGADEIVGNDTTPPAAPRNLVEVP